ncbi:MAG: hypothetical protein RB296_04135 [Acidobacteriota bacterium]|jgi:hypothetical protein|nr:hypothetical protein [Acidobacteriota bacterium]
MRGLILGLLIVVLIAGLMYTLRDKDGETIVEQKVNRTHEANIMLLNTTFVRIREALNTYFIDHGEYPEILELLVPDYIRNPREIHDPWNMPLRLERDETLTTVIRSAGPDNQWHTGDDIRREI